MDEKFTIDNIGGLFAAAMEKGEFCAYFQPKYDALTGKLSGAEALSRWISGGKVIPPDSFIPLLEELGYAVRELDWFMLDKVCALLKRQIGEGIRTVPISVNFSRLHTCEADFAEKLCATVDKYGVPHNLIEAEITESALEKCGKSIVDFIADIRKAGFSVSIDDFGSGLSSLSFVKDVPANVLKIDKSLLSKNCENEKERIVLESIFGFAHRLTMETVAEGVETKEQLGFLRTCGCTLIQGYLFAKPMPEANFYELCRNALAKAPEEDILVTQPAATATQLLLEAVFKHFPLVIMSNLSRNSFYMMAYDNFTTTGCPSTGIYTELIQHGAATMHPDDAKLFADTFDVERQLKLFSEGVRTISVTTRQLGDDGIYRSVETTNHYVQNPSADDVLAITLSRSIE